MRLLLLLTIVCFLAFCKSQAPPVVREIENVTLISDYSISPDEVILHLKLLSKVNKKEQWYYTAEVIRQVRAGFGFKRVLKTGQKIVLHSKNELRPDVIFCSAVYMGMLDEPSFYLIKQQLTDKK